MVRSEIYDHFPMEATIDLRLINLNIKTNKMSATAAHSHDEHGSHKEEKEGWNLLATGIISLVLIAIISFAAYVFNNREGKDESDHKVTSTAPRAVIVPSTPTINVSSDTQISGVATYTIPTEGCAFVLKDRHSFNSRGKVEISAGDVSVVMNGGKFLGSQPQNILKPYNTLHIRPITPGASITFTKK
jgi:hypothetical protein